MKFDLNKILGISLTLFTCLSAGSCAKETVGKKIDRAIDQTKETAANVEKEVKEKAKEAKDKSAKLHDQAKEKAREGIDRL